MKLEIKKEDIDQGLKKDSEYCPIALAMRRIRPESPFIFVFPNEEEGKLHISLSSLEEVKPEMILLYFGGREALSFQKRFDAGELVEPCLIELDPIPTNGKIRLNYFQVSGYAKQMRKSDGTS